MSGHDLMVGDRVDIPIYEVHPHQLITTQKTHLTIKKTNGLYDHGICSVVEI